MSSPDGSPPAGRSTSSVEVRPWPAEAADAAAARPGRAMQLQPQPALQGEPPSGAQVELSYADQRATVVEVGGGLRSYEICGTSVLDGYDRSAMCTGARGQLLVPWPNRIADGRYEHEGEVLQLPLSEPVEHHAIHGLTRWASWRLRQPDPATVLASYLLRPQPGYPFTLQCEASYHLGPDGLTVSLEVTNRASRSAPVGLGVHPYLLAGDGPVDAVSLQVPGQTRLVTDRRGIPTGREDVAGTRHDFRQPRPIGDLLLDTAYTDLIRDPDGCARVQFARPDGWTVCLWADSGWPYLQVYTGDTLPPVERRRSLAVEPMTCPPNGFNERDGSLVVGPAETVGGRWGIQARRR
jgi:aldose 1-epimerase